MLPCMLMGSASRGRCQRRSRQGYPSGPGLMRAGTPTRSRAAARACHAAALAAPNGRPGQSAGSRSAAARRQAGQGAGARPPARPVAPRCASAELPSLRVKHGFMSCRNTPHEFDALHAHEYAGRSYTRAVLQQTTCMHVLLPDDTLITCLLLGSSCNGNDCKVNGDASHVSILRFATPRVRFLTCIHKLH